mgnify:CR=1 FL=1
MMRFIVLLVSLPFLILGQSVMSEPTVSAQQAETIPAAITTDQLHFFLVPIGDHMRVGEYHVLSNSGESAYEGVETAAGRRVVGFSLPEGAANLQFDGLGLGERFMEEEGGFALTEPIPPGKNTQVINFSYDLPGGEGLTLTRSSETAVASVMAMVSSSGLGLESNVLIPQGTVETEMGLASLYVGPAMEPGQIVSLTLVPAEIAPVAAATPAPVARAAPTGTGTGAWILGALALAAALAFAYYQWRPGTPQALPDWARAEVQEIARLDQAYEEGKVTPESYAERRAALVARVRSRLERSPEP